MKAPILIPGSRVDLCEYSVAVPGVGVLDRTGEIHVSGVVEQTEDALVVQTTDALLIQFRLSAIKAIAVPENSILEARKVIKDSLRRAPQSFDPSMNDALIGERISVASAALHTPYAAVNHSFAGEVSIVSVHSSDEHETFLRTSNQELLKLTLKSIVQIIG